MAKLTLTDGTIFEGTTEEIFAITEKFGAKSDDSEGVESEELRVGDRVEIVNASAGRWDDLKDGDIGTIVDTNSAYSETPIEVATVDNYDYFPASALRKVVDKPKAEAVPTPLKVGDYAKVVDLSRGESYAELGDIVKVDKMSNDRFVYYTVLRNGKRSGMFAKRFVKATDEEVAEAKAKAEVSAEQARKDAIFTQVGRKPNEYRKGDIVRYIGSASTNGMLVEVVADTNDWEITQIIYHDKIGLGKCGESANDLEIVAFVESRLDRN